MATTAASLPVTTVNTIVLISTLLAGLTVFVRLVTRGILVRSLTLDDAFITLSMVFSIGLAVTVAIEAQNGLGKRIDQLTPQQQTDAQEALWASIWVYNLGLTSTKIALLLHYRRIFPTPRSRTACWVVLGFVAVYGVWTLFGTIFFCQPLEFFWDKSIAGGSCLSEKIVWFLNASVSIVEEVVLLLMPILVLKYMNISNGYRLAAISLLSLGGAVIMISIVRLQPLAVVADSPEPILNNAALAIISAVESNLAIVVACLPCLGPLLESIINKYFPEPYEQDHRRLFDEERLQPGKHVRSDSASSHALTVTHSRKGSASRPLASDVSNQGHSRMNSGNSRPGTAHALPKFHSRSQSNDRPWTAKSAASSSSSSASSSSKALSRAGSELRTNTNRPITPKSPSRGLNRPNKPSPLSDGHKWGKVHPLRMSPFSPSAAIPKLPHLPEDMSQFGKWEPANAQTSAPGSSKKPGKAASGRIDGGEGAAEEATKPSKGRRIPRKPVTAFMKPLPITPFPVL